MPNGIRKKAATAHRQHVPSKRPQNPDKPKLNFNLSDLELPDSYSSSCKPLKLGFLGLHGCCSMLEGTSALARMAKFEPSPLTDKWFELVNKHLGHSKNHSPEDAMRAICNSMREWGIAYKVIR